jgi:hypothetical protein
VNLLVLALIVAAAISVGVALMYAVRRVTKVDYFLADTTRGSAIFGVVGTAFAVLLAFVMFVAFQSFNEARDSSEAESSAVGSMFRTARFFAPAERDELQGELSCYAKAVVHKEWPTMSDGESSPVVDEWRLEIEDTLRGIDLRTPIEQAGFRQLLDERTTRSEARRERLLEADPIISPPVWFILALGGLATVGFVLLFTDRRESFPVQASLIATVSALVSASLVLVWFLDHPFEDATGSVQPTEMERTVENMESENPRLSPPCDREGDPAAV